jgi:hypothetical protein
MTTVGYGDIVPTGEAEYRVATVVMLVGVTAHAFLIGSFASALAGLDAARTRFFDRAESMLAFLRARGAPPTTLARVSEYHDHMWDKHGGYVADDALSALPDPLRAEIMMALAGPLLDSVPLFAEASPSLRALLVTSMRLEVHPPESMVVWARTSPSEIHIVIGGELELLDDQSRPVGRMTAGDTMGLLPLLLGEARSVSARTVGYCDVFVMGADRFDILRRDSPEFSALLRTAGRNRSPQLARLIENGILI